MATSTKESALSSSLSQEPTAQNAGGQSPRTDAIGIEIPVVLYASRYSAAGRGLSKTPPPVREETRTVIVFAQGAVVRLSANIAVGEMVVLTNLRTGADVLCHVAAVKTQPGIQNYVDLEFTQRAPGFWEGRSATDSSVPSEPAARAGATVPAVPAPKQHSDSPAWLRTESAPAIAAARSDPDAAANPNAPLPIEAGRTSPAHTVVPPSSNAVLGMSAGLRLAQSDPATLTGDRLDWSSQTQPSSRKGLWAAIASVAVAGIVAGGLLLNHRGQSASPETGITVAAPSVTVQPATTGPSDEPQTPVAEDSASSTAAVPVQAPTWLPDTPQHDQPQAESVAQPAPPAPRRSAIPVGNLATPIAKAPVAAGSSEPPPVLLTQDNAAAEGVLRSGELSGSSHIEAPTAFAAAENPPVHPAGGQLQMPEPVSSPDPVYPPAARAQSVQGVVVMDALVDATGNVAEVKVISGPIVLRQAAVDALRKWKYQPARLDGKPTSTHTQVNIAFKLR